MSTDRVRGLGFVVRGCSGVGALGLGIRNVLRRFRVQQRLRSPDEASDFMMVASIRMMVLNHGIHCSHCPPWFLRSDRVVELNRSPRVCPVGACGSAEAPAAVQGLGKHVQVNMSEGAV